MSKNTGDDSSNENSETQQRDDAPQKTRRNLRVIDPENLIPFPEPTAKNHYICGYSNTIPLQLLYSAYMQGVFPWFCEDDGEPVYWYSPDPRFVLRMENLHVPKSVDRFLKHTPYTYTMDVAFTEVMKNCRNMERTDQNGTWIGPKMIRAYTKFHEAGFAHSVEVWHDKKLVGGLYGVLIGSVFCGESMFTLESDSAKSAFVLFARAFEACGGKLIDSQVYTDNIARYGATNISRQAFLRLEQDYIPQPLNGDLKKTFDSLVSKLF